MTHRINDFNSDRFEIVLSNIPFPTNATRTDMESYNGYIVGVSIPGLTNSSVSSYGPMGVIRYNPMPKFNQDLGDVTLTFRLEEDFHNWLSLRKWMVELRRNRSVSGEMFLHSSTIKEISIRVKDNQVRNTSTLVIQDFLIKDLSGIDLSYTSSENVNFTITGEYREIDIR
jgi:hypothetical protein